MNQKTITRHRKHLRIRSRASGTAEKPRIVVYRSLQATYVQAIDDTTGKVLAQASDLHVKAKSGKPLDRAMDVGRRLGEGLKEKKVTTALFDRAGYKYHGRVKAIAEGARETGLKF